MKKKLLFCALASVFALGVVVPYTVVASEEITTDFMVVESVSYPTYENGDTMSSAIARGTLTGSWTGTATATTESLNGLRLDHLSVSLTVSSNQMNPSTSRNAANNVAIISTQNSVPSTNTGKRATSVHFARQGMIENTWGDSLNF